MSPQPRSTARIRPVQNSLAPVYTPPPLTECKDGYWIISSRPTKCPPSDPDSSRELGYIYRTPRGMVPYSRDDFLGSLRPDRPVCFVIHGSYNYWPDVLSESAKSFRWVMQAAHGRPVQFVYFSWPSDGYAHVVFPVELAVMGRRSAVHGVFLANLITKFPREQPVTIMGHSHGARCAVAALHALGGGAVDDGSRLPAESPVPARIRSVLLAAAVDHDWLNPGECYGQALQPVERMLVVHNPRDGWLGVYPLKNLMGNDAALGYRGLQFEDQMKLSELGQKITLLDASHLAGRSHDFGAFHSRPEFASAIAPFVTFEDEAGPPTEGDPYRPSDGSERFAPPIQSGRPPESTANFRKGGPANRQRSQPVSNPRGNPAPVTRAGGGIRGPQPVEPARTPAKIPIEEQRLTAPQPRPRLSVPTDRHPRAEMWVEPVEEGEES